MAGKRDDNEFVNKWKQLDGELDAFERLKEMRSLVAKGAVSQEVYENAHRYLLERNMSDKKKKKMAKQRSQKTMRRFEEKTLMEGHLFKRSLKSGRNWRRRYFKLFTDRLEYYHKRADKAPSGVILLNKNWYAADSILRRIKNSRKNGFMLSDFSQTVYLAAETPEDKTYWMHTIVRVLRKLSEADALTDRPVLMGQHQRSKSVEEREYKARVEAYRKLNGINEAAKRASRASLQLSDPAAKSAAKKGAPKKAKAKKAPRAAQPAEDEAAAALLLRREAEAENEKDGEEEKVQQAAVAAEEQPEGDRAQQADEDANQHGAEVEEQDEEEEEEEDDEEHGEEETKAAADAAPASPANRRSSTALLRTSTNGSRIPSTRLAVERESKAKSIAAAALAAHESARVSVQSNLGLNVMSYAEQQELREHAAEAERVKVEKDLENAATMNELSGVAEEEQRLKALLREARKAGDEERAAALEEEYVAVRKRLDHLEEVAVRTAAERAEAEDVVERTESIIAEASAANAIVLELAKVDEAILRAEQMVENAEAARRRAEAAAAKVRGDALKESEEKERELARAELAAQKAAEQEMVRAEAERRAMEKLEALAAQKVSEKQRKKVEELAAKAAIARAEAEEARFLAELEATQLENAKLDAMAKAAAVEKALRETQHLIETSRANTGMEALGFAALRREKEEAHRESAAQRRSGAASAQGAAGLVGGSASKTARRKSSIMNRLRGATGSAASKPKVSRKTKDARRNSAKKAAQPDATKDEKAAAAKAAEVANQSGPMEAANSFMSFFSSFTQAAVDGIEYVTGFRLGEVEDDEETLVDDREVDDVLSDSDYSEDSEFDDRFDERLRAVGEEERLKAAAAWIEFEMNRLLDVIHEIGSEDEFGRPVATFGQLLEVYEDISDTLVGILLRAKRAGKVYYEGDMLFEVENDDTEIVALEESA